MTLQSDRLFDVCFAVASVWEKLFVCKQSSVKDGDGAAIGLVVDVGG